VAATLLACYLLDQDLEAACDLRADLVPRGRGNVLDLGDHVLVDDSYNANPDSMRAAIAGFLDMVVPEPKWALIGEMLELGDEAAQAHMSLLPMLRQMHGVICVGEGTRALALALGAPWFNAADNALLECTLSSLGTRGSLLVKGSNRVFWAQDTVSRLAAVLNA